MKHTAHIGDKLIRHYGALHTALRASQEPKMQEEQVLVGNDRIYLKSNPVLRGDVMELHRIGAEPRYRGDSPGTFRVRGATAQSGRSRLHLKQAMDICAGRKDGGVRRYGDPV